MTAYPQPRNVVAEFDRAVGSGDVAALDAVCHPDMVTHSFGPTMPQGIAGMRRFASNRKAHRSAGGWQHVVVIADGEYVVQFGTRTFDWPGGPFRGFDVPPGTAPETARSCSGSATGSSQIDGRSATT